MTQTRTTAGLNPPATTNGVYITTYNTLGLLTAENFALVVTC